MPDVAMPRLSDSMEEGTILKWLKSDGDEVKRGEELVEIETDKANMTYEADAAGVLKIVAQEGDTLPVGDTIAQIGADAGGADEASGQEPQVDSEEQESPEQEPAEPDDGGESGEQPAPGGADAPEDDVERVKQPAPVGTQEQQPEEQPQPDADENGRVKASPIARRMAKELGVELAGLDGSGPGGRIVKSDVEAAAKNGEPESQQPAEEAEEAAEAEQQQETAEAERQQETAAPVASGDKAAGRGETTTEELSRLQQTIARRMAESKATAPEFMLTCEVDMEAAVEFRKQLKAAAGEAPAPSFNDFVVKASALALTEFPRANGAYRDGKFELYSRVNVGIAVAGENALIVPTIFDADSKSLGQISRDSRALAERVREGKITPPELSSGTFSVSNLGMFGIKRFTAVINPPQAAILAVGEMTPRPVVHDGEIAIRTILELTLSCDHRILYGADAAQFLGRIRERLENPLSLAL
jgi:pyruvate dehydrogenase E2 component (dihydrolipoamide acetyltransferase)